MKLIKQSHKILSISNNPLQSIEAAGRTCYKSEDKITAGSAKKFVTMLRDRHHEAMLEFGYMTVRFITNRGVTHELVRHRLCSFAQESTRYVNYSGTDMEFIVPVWFPCNISPCANPNMCPEIVCAEFRQTLMACETTYKNMLKFGWTAQQAREVLPNALKTEIVVQANLREWRHIFQLRCSPAAHPQMRELMLALLVEAKTRVPIIFDDIIF